MVLLPAFGALSDRIGRRALGLVFALGGAVLIVPLTMAFSDHWLKSLAVDLAVLTLTACIFSVLAAVRTEQFPSRMRAMGVGAHPTSPPRSSVARHLSCSPGWPETTARRGT